jgi:cytochrome c nitrite reductase small subunit
MGSVPGPRLRLSFGLIVGLLLGLAAGVGGFTFIYARGSSYMTNDPAACANCHIMREHFDGWLRSSHRSVAVCNDCHTPAGLIGKYWTKAENGFWHSFAFTSGNFPDPLRIKPGNRAIAERACRKCHASIVHDIEGQREDLPCLRCHPSVGHEVNR